MSDERPTAALHGIVVGALKTFQRYPNADPRALLGAIEREVGVSPGEAWRLYQIVPIAACHVSLRGIGPPFSPEYLTVRRGHPIRSARRRVWADEPLYRATVEVIEHADDHGITDDQVLCAVWYSAEMSAISQSKPVGNDLGELKLPETILIEYEEAGTPPFRRLTDWVARVFIPGRDAPRPSRGRD